MNDHVQKAFDKAMILNPDDWPVWPVLPMERHRHGETELGIVLAGHSTTIYLCSMFDSRLKTDPASIEKKEYESVIDLLGDGWVVD